MRIRQIELVGFKSFREPTRLTLSPGINAVVGPNGCGKSNVVDAIRWTLGEMSVKHLRAREMEDVIFCGNAKSPPLNFAEVSLTFEQADDDSLDLAGEAEGLAAQVARLHEFTVTRRIFRSGDSQYLINQAPVRLRDITELFLGSGVGPKAYAMIEQGRVGHIVSAKPEELRLFIEEAAGTTRFRSRKLAAERKLERTGENLARVQDVMREIDRQLGTLRRQAKRAEEYRLLQAELERTEVAVAGARWRFLAQERDALEAELAQAERRVATCQAELEAGEAARSHVAVAEQRVAGEIEAAFAGVAEVSGAVVRATERQRGALEAAAGLGARIERSEKELAGLYVAADEALRGVSEAQGRRAEWVERESLEGQAVAASEREVEGLGPSFERAQAEQTAAATALNEKRSWAAAAASGRAGCVTRVAGLREERQRVAARLVGREEELGATRQRLVEVSADRERARQAHERLAESCRTAARELRSREDERRRLEENLTAAREALLHVRGRLEGLRERERALDGYGEGLATAMRRDPAPRGLVVDALLVPPELEPAVAAVLGDALRGAVVETPESAVAIADELRREGSGRVTLVPVAGGDGEGLDEPLPPGTVRLASLVGALPGREPVRAALLDGVALVDDLPQAVAAWRASGGRTPCVTRTGDIVDRCGVVTGGRSPAATYLLERRREVGELAAQVAEEEVRQTAVDARLAEVRDECALLGADLARLDAEAHAATIDLVRAEHAVETAQRDVITAEQRAIEARAELEASDGALGSAETAVRAAEETAARAAEAVAVGEVDLGRAEQGLVHQRSAVEAARSRRDAAREALSNARERLAQATADLARREHESAAVAARRGELGGEVEGMHREREAQAGLLASLEVELAAGREELARREAVVEQARERARQTQLELREREGVVARARRLLDEARSGSRGVEVRLAERTAQLDALAGYARERHGIDPALAEVPEGFDEAAAAARIGEIRERIARLGDVNVAAIADAKELEERYGFLENQRADLEASMEDLRRTIAELSRATRSRFRDTFDRANERFQEFFAELFRGGRAALKLTNPQNLLESGVEMEVQPPGKSVRGLESLSGGEQALTAISLLMALFSLRATPFCVLDEVDAPLDEANLGRFNAMLRRMNERTQFVVITHQQATMTSADVLYGVTMAEAGVSQLVSVELPARDSDRGEADELMLAASA